MSYRQQLIPRWIDVNGGIVTQTFHSQSDPSPPLGSLADVLTSMQAMTHCGLVYAQLAPIAVYNETPSAGAYQTVSDRAQIIVRSTAGTTGRINVPGPLESIFLPGTERVDFANPLVAGLMAAVFANLSDAYGNPWVTAVSGKRMKVVIPPPLGS